ncbi:MAG: pyroglutamyl-peptidase I [Aristaeellaceae bacterium]
MTILITGFEPFGGDSVNPSWEAVSLLPERVGDNRVCRLRLPVVFGQCGQRLMQAAEEIRPDAVICCGVAKGRTEVTPELLAVNWRMGAIADNAGIRYEGEKIDPDGPDAIMTALPVNRMVAAIRQAGLPGRLSLSAGAYVCNDLYYALMRGQARYGYRGLFIHVPAESELSFADTARALLCCIRTLQP